jgi:hypothetical protein
MLAYKINPDKIVVFDLDETLGYFTQIGIFWDALKSFYKNINDNDIFEPPQNQQEIFNTLIEIYPEFLRVNILSILNYLKRKKTMGKCKHVMIYTNNHASNEWLNLIINYFHEKLNYKLFDRIIRAFKVNGKIVELCRTTNDKKLNDLFNCTKIPSNSQICFLDDVYYSNMVDDNVYYIKLKPYIHELSFQSMIHRFLESKLGKKIKNEKNFIIFINDFIRSYNFIYIKKNQKDYELDKIVSKKIMIHLQIFFDKNWRSNNSIIKHKNTRKYYTDHHNKTNKNLQNK